MADRNRFSNFSDRELDLIMSSLCALPTGRLNLQQVGDVGTLLVEAARARAIAPHDRLAKVRTMVEVSPGGSK